MASVSRQKLARRASVRTHAIIEPLERRRMLSADVSVMQTNLVSDIPGMAQHTDPSLVNPWGISFGATSPFWVSDNGTSQTTLYDSAGNKQGLVVSIPGAGGQASAPTGQVSNSGTGFVVSEGAKSGPARFIFVGEDGGITGWNPAVDLNHAVLKVDQSGIGSVFKGVAINSADGAPYLYAADFHNGAVDVYDANWNLQNWSGAFQDPWVPKGYAPFNVQSLGNELVVTYAKQNAVAHDDVAGPGNGFVDVFSTSGQLQERFQHTDALNSPWGVAQVPLSSQWGDLAGDILVGQFGSGNIAIFRPDGHARGLLEGANEKPLVIDGLWDITFGGGGPVNAAGAKSNGDPNTLYFSAGLNGEQDGLLGSLTPQIQQNRGHHDNDDHGRGDDDHGGFNLDDLLDHLRRH